MGALRSVLLVDDSTVMRMHMGRTLRQAGFAGLQILQAANGEEALHALGTNAVDLVVSDLHMPKMDGLEFTRRVRATGSRIPILLVTAEGSVRKQTEAGQAGVSGYLTKPVTPSQIEEALAGLFDKPPGAP